MDLTGTLLNGQDGAMKARNVVGVAIGVGMLAILVVGAVVAAGRDSTDYADGTPEAVVQDYFQAVIDERPDDAVVLFSDELRERCDDDAGLRFIRVSRVVLDEVVPTQSDDDLDRVRVRVRITETWGDSLFDEGESSFTEAVSLTMEDGQWRISAAPWPYFGCRTVPEVED